MAIQNYHAQTDYSLATSVHFLHNLGRIKIAEPIPLNFL